jgi:hypothetical protein
VGLGLHEPPRKIRFCPALGPVGSPMPVYEIEQFELHAMKYRVEADSEAHAIAKLFDGEAEPVEQSQDFVEVARDFGLPADEYRELAEELRALGVPVGEAVIPSIRSIVNVD